MAARVGGTGSSVDHDVNGGTLSPGNSIGTITINGNLVLGAGAIYRVEVSPTAADRTNVTGTATLAGTAQLIFGPGTYTSNSYTILSAAGGRSGTFDNVTTDGLPATLSANLCYTATDVLLVTLTSSIAQLSRADAEPAGRRRGAGHGVQRRPCDDPGTEQPHGRAASRARSTSCPARCTPRRRACWWTRAATCAARCSDGCARPPMAATPAWRRSRSADRSCFADGRARLRARLRASRRS